MTLQECERLLKHFNDLADGTIAKPVGHKNWEDVISNAKVRAEEMEKKIAWLMKAPHLPHNHPKKEVNVVPKGTKVDLTKEKEDGKKSA